MTETNGTLEARPLYQLLARGLPSYQKTRNSGVTRLRIGEIAAAIGMAPQGIYKRFEPGSAENSITIRMARKLIDLSAKEIDRPGVPAEFRPLTLEDFAPYLT